MIFYARVFNNGCETSLAQVKIDEFINPKKN
jgi:hypothetical protein